jgi:arylsulfatase A-like enzyme
MPLFKKSCHGLAHPRQYHQQEWQGLGLAFICFRIHVFDKSYSMRFNSFLTVFARRGIVSLTLMMGLGLVAPALADASNERPNILFIMVDDLNDWVGCMGGHPAAQTPNIDALAQRGTLFTNAHAAAPICGPTRAALLSGLRPSTTGIYGHNKLPVIRDNPHTHDATLLPEYFAKHGYKTLGTGKIFHEGSPPAVFDKVGVKSTNFGPRPDERFVYTPPKGHYTSTDWGAYPKRDEQLPDYRSAQWASQQLQKTHQKPFFMAVGFIRPHVPWYVPQKWFDKHPLSGIQRPVHRADPKSFLPETARAFSVLPPYPEKSWMEQEQRWEESIQGYLASTTFTDHYIGQVLDALAQSQYANNTTIVLVSDHGYHMGEKALWTKFTLWEQSTHVPMIIARPGDEQARRTHRPVNHMDLYPTLVDLANLPANPRNEGQSVVPLLNDPQATGFDASVTTHAYNNHAVRTERWRYIRYADGTEELYDHWTDPHELHNLADRAQYDEVIQRLRRHLPENNAAPDPDAKAGTAYNDYLRQVYREGRQRAE